MGYTALGKLHLEAIFSLRMRLPEGCLGGVAKGLFFDGLAEKFAAWRGRKSGSSAAHDQPAPQSPSAT